MCIYTHTRCIFFHYVSIKNWRAVHLCAIWIWFSTMSGPDFPCSSKSVHRVQPKYTISFFTLFTLSEFGNSQICNNLLIFIKEITIAISQRNKKSINSVIDVKPPNAPIKQQLSTRKCFLLRKYYAYMLIIEASR